METLTIGAATTAAVAQVERFTIAVAADADNYTINVGEFEFVGLSVGTDIPTERNVILALMDANEDFKALYSTAAVSTDAIDVTALRPGTPYTVQETVETTSDYGWAQQTANTDGTQFKFNIDGLELLYAAGGVTPETERDALLALLQGVAVWATYLTFAAQSTDAITITANTAGDPYVITFENEDGIGRAGIAATITFVATTANVTGNPVPFGRGLARGSVADVAVLPSVTGFTIEGVSIARARARPKDNSVSPPVTGEADYKAADAVNVLRKGRIWVRPEDAVTVASDVYVRHTQGSNPLHTVGRFRKDADSAKADQWVGARWLTAAAGGEIAVLEINLP